jgi:parallel beta-helix repeat protein
LIIGGEGEIGGFLLWGGTQMDKRIVALCVVILTVMGTILPLMQLNAVAPSAFSFSQDSQESNPLDNGENQSGIIQGPGGSRYLHSDVALVAMPDENIYGKDIAASLSNLGITVLESYGNFVLVSFLPGQRESLPDNFEIIEMPDRTITGRGAYIFDTRDGEPTIPQNLKIDGSRETDYNQYIIQFIGPMKQKWISSLKEIGVEFIEYLPSFSFICSIDNLEVDSVMVLPFVQWVGIYHPAYKIDPSLLTASMQNLNIRYSAISKKISDSAAKLNSPTNSNFEMVDESNVWSPSFEIEKGSLLELANSVDIVYIMNAPGETILINDQSTGIVQTGELYNRKMFDNGLDGTGQLIYNDEMINITHEVFSDPENNTPGPNHRKVYYYGFDPEIPAGGHGHACLSMAVGDAPDNGTYGTYNKYDGNAIGARLVIDYSGYFGYEFGARIRTVSWLSTGAYTPIYDSYIWNGHSDYFMTFGFGNLPDMGPGREASSKNIVTAGGTLNGIGADSVAGGIDHYNGSWRGPAFDGRIKPTLVVPAWGIHFANTAGGYSYTGYWDGGTSYAGPVIAGCAAIVRQYFTEGWYIGGQKGSSTGFNPSAALVKAVLINGADEITGDGSYDGGNFYPNNDQGWGRINLDNSLYIAGDERKLIVYDQDVTRGFTDSGQNKTFAISVSNSSQPFEVTLVWSDYPGTTGAEKALVNDLDLTVTDPNGNHYKGNDFVGCNPGHSNLTIDGNYDDINVEEGVLILTPTPGVWTIEVTARNLVYGPQPFALAITGATEGTIENTVAFNVDTDLEYASIQDAIDATETLNGHTIQIFTGTHVESVYVDKSVIIIGQGSPEFVTVEDAGAGYVFHLQTDNVTIDGLTIRNGEDGISTNAYSSGNTITDNILSNLSGEGIHLFGSSENLVANNTFMNCTVGIFIAKGGQTPVPEQNIISGNLIRDGENGIELLLAKSNTIIENTIENNSGYGIYLWGTVTQYNSIYHNNFVGNFIQADAQYASLNSWDNGYPDGGNYWDNYSATDYYYGANQDYFGSDCICDAPMIINANEQDNYALVSEWPMIPKIHNLDTGLDYFVLANAIYASETLDGHTIMLDPGTFYASVEVYQSLSIVGGDRDTTIIDGGGYRIVFYLETDNVIISGLTIQNGESGISTNAYSSGNTITNNRIANQTSSGVNLFGSSENVVTGNIISGCGESLSLYKGGKTPRPTGNLIQQNQIDNGTYGILLFIADENSIIENVIRDCEYGVSIDDGYSQMNAIFHNDFIDNAIQAESMSSGTNYWDDGYPLGGNYWSDKAGNDLFSGPNQDLPNGDNIFDTPYAILSSDDVDRYPLTTPFGSWTAPIVYNVNKGLNYWTIQEAVTDADTFDTIIVNTWGGTLYENVLIDKEGLTIIGRGTETTIVDGSGGDVFTIQASNVNISGLTIQNGTRGIISDPECNQLVLRDCIIADQSIAGIDLWSSSDCIISNNTLSDNNFGIHIHRGGHTPYSERNMIDNNSIIGNAVGISLVGVRYGVIVNNEIIDSSETGIMLRASSGNEIYHNSFVDNLAQADCDSYLNTWDDGYPSGGNYWSDWTGPDVKGGPGQDQPWSDGIVDARPGYQIAANNIDNYPFLNNLLDDTTPPTAISILINGGNQYTTSQTVTLSVSATDGLLGSGVGWMHFSNDGTTWSDWETFSLTKSGWVLTSGEGTKTVRVMVKDHIGLESTIITDTIELETDNAYIFRDSFSSGLSGWTIVQTGGSVATDGSTGKISSPSLKIYKNVANGVSSASHTFTTQTSSRFIVQAWLQMSASADYSYLDVRNGAANNINVTMYKSGTKYYLGYYSNGGTLNQVMQINSGTWYWITLDVQLSSTPANSRFDIYVDGLQKKSAAVFNVATSTLDNVYFQAGRRGQSASITLWVDDVAVRPGGYLLMDPFDNFPTAPTPPGGAWTTDGGGGAVPSKDTTKSYGKVPSVKMVKSKTTGKVSMQHTFASQSTHAVAEASMMVSNIGPTYYSYFILKTGTVNSVYVGINDGQLKYYDNTGWHAIGKSVSINTWYRITVDVKITARTYDIYVDGALIFANAPWYNGGQGSSLDSIYLQSGDASSTATLTTWVDDVYISS